MKEAAKVKGGICQLWKMLNFLKPQPQIVVSQPKKALVDLSIGR